MLRPPSSSVRGRVLDYLLEHLPKLEGRVIAEVGSRRTQPDSWRDLRGWVHALRYVGFDMEDGLGVDEVVNFERTDPAMIGEGHAFDGVICSEVLEHVRDPIGFLSNVLLLLKTDGLLIVTTLFAFPFHPYPNDFWRFSEQGLRQVLEASGFQVLETKSGGEVSFELSDHGEAPVRKTAPMHTFALAVRGSPSWL